MYSVILYSTYSGGFVHRISKAAIVAACAVAVACGGDSSTGPKNQSIAGNWTLTASISNASLQISCTAQGTASFTQTGTNFSGQVSGSTETCTGPGGTITDTADGPLMGGQISGNSVSYSDGLCSYNGTISGNPANRVNGSVSCQIPISGTNYPFTGTFTLAR